MIKLFQIRKPDDGIETIGDYFVKDEAELLFTCKTLELPFKGNQRGVSCFPAGDYKCKKIPATEKIPYQHIAILDIPGREGCCIHIANFAIHPQQLEGCTAVGSELKDINNDGNLDAVSSKVAFDRLMMLLPDEFELSVNYELPKILNT